MKTFQFSESERLKGLVPCGEESYYGVFYRFRFFVVGETDLQTTLDPKMQMFQYLRILSTGVL